MMLIRSDGPKPRLRSYPGDVIPTDKMQQKHRVPCGERGSMGVGYDSPHSAEHVTTFHTKGLCPDDLS